ncbi:uncharacterized protein LOC116001433 [Ipomoea triloba]|uniref:uncharacterized protein LOC116001433 n=1 Tax=Ipomoea triloba TaxID=35885 RepID=UPI00125E676E|nr:uncharacterized protein LOC116001433 [Ipomoea triloba]
MEQLTETLSEENPSTATPRSPEDEDLLKRSTKKTKRNRAMAEQTMTWSFNEGVQGASASAGLMSPGSAQWRTPVETPSNMWGRKENATRLDDVEVSDEESMEVGESDPNCPVITVTKEEKERLRRPWRRTLIIKVLGRKIGYSFLLQRLQKLWKPEASFDLIAIDQEFFLARFESLRDYEFAKFEGPWIILGHYLTVQEWRPNLFPHTNKLDKLLVWVRFPALPIEYFEEDFLKKIGMNIARPVKTDTTTSLVSIGKFARVCVELDLSRRLLSKFTLEGEVVPIEYEGIQMVCFKCGMYGHKKDQCGGQNLNEEGKGAEAQTDQEQNDKTQTKGKEQPKYQYTKPVRDFSKNFGEWMLVARKERKGYRRDGARAPNTGNRNHVQSQAAGAGGPQFQSRYAVLEDLDNNGNEL